MERDIRERERERPRIEQREVERGGLTGGKGGRAVAGSWSVRL
jgi:hypothetical protein